MKVAFATLEDVPRLCLLLDLLFSQEEEFRPDRETQTAGLTAIVDNPEVGRILVLHDQDEIVGMVNLLFTVSTALGGRVAILEDMVVDGGYRGSGAGSRLLEAAIGFAKDAGCRRITLLTDRTNLAAQRFYGRHGFVISDMLPMRRFLD
jgi:GNAT superfamily N-acetyltransferase